MDDEDTINITICGDGGCGTYFLSSLSFRQQANAILLGKSSITLRLVKSQWTNE